VRQKRVLLDANVRWHNENRLALSLPAMSALFCRNTGHWVTLALITPQASIAMNDPHRLAEAVRTACLDTALRAYEDAGISGLCHEGRWEFAVQAMRGMDLDAVIRQAAETPDRGA
jgi:hypothetical protein